MTNIESPINVIPSTWTTRRIIQGTLVVLSVVIGFLLLYDFRMIAVVIFSGIVISITIAPSVNWLNRRGLPRSLSVILIYFVLLVLIIGSIILLIPPIAEQITATVPKIESYYQDLRSNLINSPLLALRQIVRQLPSELNLIASTGTSSDSLDTVGQVINSITGILSGFFTLISIFLIGFYWTLEGEIVVRNLLLRLPTDKRENAREILKEIEKRIGGYVRGQAFMALTITIANFVIFSLIGLPASLAVAVAAGLFEFIPVFGPTLGAIPAILVAFSYDSSKLIWVIAAGMLVQFVENNILAPRVMHKTVGINPIVMLLSIVAFGTLFGFGGLILAIPIAAIIQIIAERSILRPQVSGLEIPSGRDHRSKLRVDIQDYVVDLRNQALHKHTGTADSEVNPIEDSLEAIAIELDQILSSTELSGNKS